ncbi:MULTISPECIES: D-2-hydroxyacid dehydrogenase [Sphingobacterium]|jgi:D-3-phosphoglycerate dehydrogenase|uniref:D-2-hydroxyacid dehydrogenase n=1 Tax=Sphingobacterium kitahiroshimense TaxID=470446 RepID=A0ABV0C1K0_9SPHI|nr:MULTISPECIES: D-2-hydroxyacid dehydrogenase [unclassified Sphingobacterium]KKX50977.1 3-phosphoglycerate dehydrogenase [Sphingobacterium sp. IITKGP-BTPF85]MBB2951754.1 D-3-phosphoglycerate dehydrogenase [Sphingobacterium sp. JUb56]MCS3557113.1 D-3-phosphoglycerate dehydrogenase [Sphingobacterium sp. JUb21]QQD13537.1 D-2-hydroxyacid dehydrogenase [Sphingobacterium sp. UDSM-2020]TCQ98156.1 D-3-phosphoglycerate dehydrogenase [Sphingobacterium sp. JUb20]
MRILANDGIDPAGKQLLEDAGFEVDTNHIPQEELAEKLQAYDAITVRSATKVRQALIDVCPNLKVIGRGGVGMDNIDVDYARSKGIAVLNTPAASSLSVAELVFAHLLNGVRFLYDSNRQMPLSGESKFGALKKAYAGGTELRGKTLGVVGFGRIGRETAKIGLGLGMDIVYYDLADGPKTLTLSLTQGFEVELPVDQVSMEDLLKTSDFITLHVPFLDKPAIGKAEFALLKDQVGLVNAARGGVIDELALIEALDSGKVAFAGLDVFDNEPTPRLEILKHPKISLTPHIGAATNEAQERIGVELAQLIIENLKK